MIKSLLSNVKFQALLASAVVLAASWLGLDLSGAEVAAALAVVNGLVLGHAADTNRAAADVAKEIADATPSTLPADARITALELRVRQLAGASGVPVPGVSAPGPSLVSKP